ncbi:MAG: c-type cytochrome [Deltaproteobacteria bacterium]|jgi:cytochrome c|nr:c-type cytochrome [Deltaproteobacteria bacterium]
MQKRFALFLTAALCLTVTVAFAYTEQQAKRGEKVFSLKCSACHGDNGQGGTVRRLFDGYNGMKAPPVAGPGALPNMETAENVYTFIRHHMPLQKPGSLSNRDYLDIVAFDLKANNIEKPSDKPLRVKDLPTIKIHGGP